jgi:CheY-like chemotaxis protein
MPGHGLIFPAHWGEKVSRTMLPKLLIVEDDADGRDALAELFRLQGFEVASAADGEATLARLRSARFDVVVMDLGLPNGGSGLGLIRTICATEERPAVVVFTGHHRLKADAEAAGCDAFVLKPDLEGLLATISSAIAAEGMRRA